MPVVLTPADGNHCSAQQRRKTQQRAREIASGVHRFGLLALVPHGPPVRTGLATAPTAHEHKQPRLARKEQAQVAQPREAEARVPARKAPPSVVQHVVARLGAHVEPDQCIGRRAWRGLAAREEIRARAADRVLDGVGEEGGEDQSDEEAEEGDVVLVRGGAQGEVERGDEEEREEAGVEDVEGDGDALYFGVGEGDG